MAGLASRSLSARSTTRDLAALLAVEAWKRSPDAASKSALFGTFTFDPGFFGFLDIPDSGSVNGQVIPGTTRVVVASYGTSGEQTHPRPPTEHRRCHEWRTDRPARATVDRGAGADVEHECPTHHRGQSSGKFAAWGGGALDPRFARCAVRYNHRSQARSDHRVDAAGSPTGDQRRRQVHRRDHDLDGRVEVYDAATGTLVSQIPGVVGAPTVPRSGEFTAALAFTPEGQLYVGSLADRLRLFDPATARLVTEYVVPPISTASELLFSEDGTTVIARGLFYAPDGRQLGSVRKSTCPVARSAGRSAGLTTDMESASPPRSTSPPTGCGVATTSA